MLDDRDADISSEITRPWSVRSLARTSQIILGVLAVLLLALGVLMYNTMATQRDARVHASHEGDAIFALHDMLEAMIDAETGERGYLLNGESEYLEPLAQARGSYADARRRAGALVERSSYPGEAASLTVLDELVAKRLSLIDRNLALVRADRRGEAIAPERSAKGKAAMDAVRGEIERQVELRQKYRSQAIARATLYEARMPPLLALIGVTIASLVLLSVLIERRHAVAQAKAQQAEALRAAKGQAELIARELNHRVKNLFAVVLSIVSLTARSRNADRATMNELRGRIHALSIAHAVSQGQIGADTAGLADIISRVLAPYAHEESGRVTLQGPSVELPVRMVTPVGMIVHELATNAVKYGAFSTREGKVAISWTAEAADESSRNIQICWIESGGPALHPESDVGMTSGFGATMLDMAARQLHGNIERQWEISGAQIVLTFPVPV